MYIKSSRLFKQRLFIILLSLIIPCSLPANKKLAEFQSSKGLRVQIIKDDNITFTHAEILVFYGNEIRNPAIPQLVIENMLDSELNQKGSGLLGALRRLGNDFEIVNRTDYLKIKVNFLSDKMPIFVQFLKELYTYKGFTIGKLKESIAGYWRNFLKHRDWRKRIVFQIAYSKLFPGHRMGNTLILPESVQGVNFAQILSFYNQTYTLENSMLFLKGDGDPSDTVNLIEKGLRTYKKRETDRPAVVPPVVSNKQEIYIFDTKGSESPKIYWFEVIPPLRSEAHLSYLIINNVLFGYPMGALCRNAEYFGIRNLKIEWEILNHRHLSIICNTVGRLSYRDMEKFILLAGSEKKKLAVRNIGRQERLNALNYFYGKFKVNTEDFEYDLHAHIEKELYELKRDSTVTSVPDFREIFTRVSLNSVNRIVKDPNMFSRKGRNLRAGVIIIAGDAESITRHMRMLKPNIIRMNRK